MLIFNGVCTLFCAFSLDIIENLSHLNDSKIGCNQKIGAKKYEINMRLFEIVKFHADGKKLSFNHNFFK